MSDKKKILLLRLMVIPSLVFFLCLFSAAFTPKDTPSVDASVMRKWVEDNRKTDSYMVHLSGGSVKKKKQAIPQGLYRKIEIGDQVKLIQSSPQGSWIYINTFRNGVEVIPTTNINSVPMIMFGALLVLISFLAYLPSRWLLRHGSISVTIFMFGCFSTYFSVDFIVALVT